MDYPAIRYPLHLETATPLILSRTEVTLEHPAIENMYERSFESVNFDPTLPHPCVAALTPTSEFEPLLEPHWKSLGLKAEDVGTECLVLSLSSAFEGAEAAFAAQRPTVFNTRDLDLISVRTYLGWSACLPGETALTTVQVLVGMQLDRALMDVERKEPQRWGWMPMVIVGSDTVAVGGFAIDEQWLEWIGQMQMSTQHRVFELYSPAELEAAAESAATHGNQPWLYQRWRNGSQWLVEAPLLISQISRNE